MKHLWPAFFLLGCAAGISEQGKKVRIVSAETVVSCKFVQQLNVLSSLGGKGDREKAKFSATNQARNEAAKLGASHLVIVGESAGMDGATILGDAYSCPDK
ncbi:MAG: DUF4156 domain-containing protein [Fibrobacteria bacterium]